MNLISLISMALPEIIAMLIMIYILLNKPINKINLCYSVLIYLGMLFFIKNTIPLPMSFILTQIVIITIVYKFSKSKMINCLIASILVMSVKLILEWMIVVIGNLMGINFDIVLKYKMLKIVMCNITVVIMFIISYSILKFKIKKNKSNILNLSISEDLEYIIILANILIMIILVVPIIHVYSTKDAYYDMGYLILGFLIFALVISCISIMILILINSKKKALADLEKNLMKNNLKQMEDNIDLLRIQKHDYMNHLQVILMQITAGKVEQARNYILDMSNHESESIMHYSTGNTYIDAILNTKKRRASRYNIELTACIDSLLEDIELSDSELSSTMLNIIDNAIDELKKHDRDDKYIHVDVYSDEEVYNLSIKNNGSKIIDTKKIFEMGYSSKGKNRGYGLYSIKKLLESYNCTLEVYSDDIETEFIIQLPVVAK